MAEILNTFIDEIPLEVRDAAILVDRWMQENGHDSWEYLSICSRDHAYDLERLVKVMEECRARVYEFRGE